MSQSFNETIAAVATPLGSGGIGIVRISGAESRAVGLRVFQPARRDFSDFKPYVLHHGWIKDAEGRQLDEVLTSFMPGPGSYTGEDVLEVNCHGGPAVVQVVLERVLALGVRAAGPGEFTYRAFLNKRLDLSQAESVAELIAAPSESGLRFAGQKLAGALGQEMNRLREELLQLKALLGADLDFPEDGLESLSVEDICRSARRVEATLQELLDNFSRYNCFREGALVVLAGRVNAGKSSLLNRLLGRSRAIVTPIPGTTRDYLEEMVNLQGLPVKLVDTAGLRSTPDPVEQAGLTQGAGCIRAADLLCLVLDSSEPVSSDMLEPAHELGPERVLLVLNKCDLGPAAAGLQERIEDSGFEAVSVSARTGAGIEALISGVRGKIIGSAPEPGGDRLVPNLRQKQKIREALSWLQELEAEARSGSGLDLLTLSLDAACRALAEVTGEISSEDVLEQVFSRFCIGK